MGDKVHRLDLDGGKYTILLNDDGSDLQCLRHGEPWRNMVGDSMIYLMAVEIQELRSKRDEVAILTKTFKDRSNDSP